MLFSSFEFIALFLPFVVFGYFLMGKIHHRGALLFLTLSSLVFYGWWNVQYVVLLVASIIFNYHAGVLIRRHVDAERLFSKTVMLSAIGFNILVLSYFKYADFLIANSNQFLGTHIPALGVILPLGISFFTFQAIAYLADCYQKKVVQGDLLDFALFKSFFPQLIAGPIVHHAEMMPQFAQAEKSRVDWGNVACGIFLFSIGIFKKLCIADSLAPFASWGFDEAPLLSMTESWLTVLSYSFQLYFDFSGYIDMALGAALIFNIKLPVNFNSPYKATSIQDFWRRWHITLGRFLREYLYVPMGGNQKGRARQMVALMITFILGGLWHGASWTFVTWGLCHGAAVTIYLLWQRVGFKLNRYAGLFLTFLFVSLTWVLFRARDYEAVAKVFTALFSFDGWALYEGTPFHNQPLLLPGLAAAAVLCFFAPNSEELRARFRPDMKWLLFALGLLACSFYKLGDYSEFLYFQF